MCIRDSHRAMELLSYEGSAEEQLKEIMQSEKMPAEGKELLDKEAVLTFLESCLLYTSRCV